MKRLFQLSIIISVCLSAVLDMSADVPAGYYKSINGKRDAELKTAICNLVYNHTEVSSYNDLPKYFQRTDVYPQSNRWWDMYSDIPLYAPSFSGLNREHAFPKSWWGGLTNIPAYVDLNHLYPSEAKANQAKSNYPLGTVSTSTYDNGIVKVGYAVTGQGGGAAKVFEPADEYKGDFARTYFYMVTCYQNLTWNRSYMWMLQQNTYPTLAPWAQQLLLKWSKEDPVSQKERNRNEQVYMIQNNRNPFIDYPELAEYIWGEKVGELFYESSTSEPGGTPNLITPVQGMSLEFGQVALGSSTTARLFFQGENLVKTLSITVTGTDKSYFTIDTKSINSSLVNSESGYWLTVTYTPAALGQHTAKIIVSDGGISGSRGVELIGECMPVPTLSAFKALPPTDITSDSYVANWEEPSDVVDYYIVTRTRYTNGTSSSEDLLAETNSLLIEDFNSSASESYNVRSVRLGYESPRSNEVFVEHGGVTGVRTDTPLGTAYYPGGIRFVCGQAHTNAVIYDVAGRLIDILPVIENNMEISLPYGVYMIVTDQQHTPVRVIVRD